MTATTINGKKPKFFTTPIADSGTKNDIPATGTDETVSQQLGFGNKFSTPRGSGGKSVGRADMNGLFNGVSSLNYYFQYTGRNPWVSGQSYPKGAKVFYDKSDTDKAEYVSTKDDNTDTPGASGVTSWIKLNDLSGTSGGGSTVDCAWSGKGTDISNIIINTGKISGIESKVNSLTSDVSTLKTDMSSVKSDVSTLKTSVSSMKTSVDNMSTKVNTLQESVNVLKSGTQFSFAGLSGFNFTHTNTSVPDTSDPTVMALPGWLAACKGFSNQYGDHNLDGNITIELSTSRGVLACNLPTCYIPAGTKIKSVKYDDLTSNFEPAMIKYDFSGVSFPSSASKTLTLTPIDQTSGLATVNSSTWNLASTSKIAKIAVSVPAYSGSNYAAYAIFFGYANEKVGRKGVCIMGTPPSSSGFWAKSFPTTAYTMEFIIPANCYYTIGAGGTGYATSLSVSEYVRSN